LKKIIRFGLPLLILVAIGGGWLLFHQQPQQQPTKPAKTAVKTKPKYRSLTRAELNRSPKLKYCSIVYYAIKHSKIQRWQEVSNFDLGWQLEQYPITDGTKVLVWPDMDIKKGAKLVQPNWFALSNTGNVTYHSFVVHSFRDDMTESTDLDTIIKQLNTDHAAMKVRHMLPNALIVAHKNTAN